MIDPQNLLGRVIPFSNEDKHLNGKVVDYKDDNFVAVVKDSQVFNIQLGKTKNICSMSMNIGTDVSSVEKALEMFGYNEIKRM